MYSYAWVDDPIVNGFIPESGTAGLSASPSSAAPTSTTPASQANTEPKGLANWHKATAKLNCGDAQSAVCPAQPNIKVPCGQISAAPHGTRELLHAPPKNVWKCSPCTHDAGAAASRSTRPVAWITVRPSMVISTSPVGR